MGSHGSAAALLPHSGSSRKAVARWLLFDREAVNRQHADTCGTQGMHGRGGSAGTHAGTNRRTSRPANAWDPHRPAHALR